MQNLLDILYEQCLWNSLKYIGSTELLGSFLPTAVDYQMIRNVGMPGISLKEKSAKVHICPWQVARSMYYTILI